MSQDHPDKTGPGTCAGARGAKVRSPVARFEYFAPKTMDEALSLLRENGPNARVLAGGTDLVLKLREGFVTASALVALKGIEGLDRIVYDADEGLSIGATTLLSDFAEHPEVVSRYPALREAALATANVQVRNMGTVVGNLCNASPCADNAPTLIATGATAVVMGPGGVRRVALGEFFTGPGTCVVEPGEIVTSIRVPPPPKGSGAAYLNLSQRSRVDMSAVGAGVFLVLASGRIRKARIVMGSVGPVPLRAKKAEASIEGRAPSDRLFAGAGKTAAGESRPISDVRASAAYRRATIGVLVERALARAASRARGK